jgi:deoxyribodipyrimidine photolyase
MKILTFAIGGLFMNLFKTLKDKLNPTNSKLYFFHSEVQPVFAELLKHYDINTVFHIKKLVTSAPSIGI